jgi:hypothetical protein
MFSEASQVIAQLVERVTIRHDGPKGGSEAEVTARVEVLMAMPQTKIALWREGRRAVLYRWLRG